MRSRLQILMVLVFLLLGANVFAQSEVLASGKTEQQVKAEGTPDWLVPHRVFQGNRPSNTLLAKRLDPASWGKLVSALRTQRFQRRASPPGTSIRSISGASS